MSSNQTITTNHLNNLIEASGDPQVSIFLRMERQGPETRKNRIELKSAIKQAQGLMKEKEVDESTAVQCLEKLEALLENEDFWQIQNHSLALYASPDGFSPFLLGVEVDPRIKVSRHFAVLPLLAELDATSQAYVLQLSEKTVKLHHWRNGSMEELEVPNLPKDMDEALQLDHEKNLQTHTVSGGREGGPPVEGLHGHGGGRENELEYRTEFMQRVNTAVVEFINTSDDPLVLATVVKNFGLYEKINTYPHLDRAFIEGNFDRVNRSELEQKTRSFLEGLHRARSQAGLADLQQVKNGERTSGDLKTLMRAAHEGRIKTLYVKWPANEITGTWNEETFEAMVDEKVQPLNDDLIDRIAAVTHKQGGLVRIVPSELWERKESCFGEFRWSESGRG